MYPEQFLMLLTNWATNIKLEDMLHFKILSYEQGIHIYLVSLFIVFTCENMTTSPDLCISLIDLTNYINES